MKQKKLVVGILAVAVVFLCTAVYANEAFVSPTGLIKYDKTTTFNGYTLLAPFGAKDIYIIDNDANILHKWETPYTPGAHAILLENGNLLTSAVLPDPPIYFGGSGGLIRELSWDNKVVWEYKLHNATEVQHHTFTRMPNGNTLILYWEQKSWDEAIAKGRDPKKTYPKGVVSPYDPRKEKPPVMGVWPDAVREVDKNGKTVWEWHAWDHVGKGPDKIDPNQTLPESFGLLYAGPDWTHFNSVQYLEETDQLILNSRNFGEFYIIDHKTGKIVYRWGNPSMYGAGKAPAGYNDDGDQILFGPHHVWKQPNGNITIFDNGTLRPSGNYSRIIEMDPKTSKIVWQFGPAMGWTWPNSFYSSFQGGVQKLPNGSYFVTSTMNGHLFEVTPDKKIAWEFVNPVSGKGPVCVANDPPMGLNVHKAFKYGTDYPAFKGKDMSPKGKLSAKCPDFKKFMDDSAAADAKK
jgi:hypothetical protein